MRRFTAFMCSAVAALWTIPSYAQYTNLGWFHQDLAGDQCNTWGSKGIGPDGAAPLINWGANPVLVDCPIPADSYSPWGWGGPWNVYANISNYWQSGGTVDTTNYVSCQLFEEDPHEHIGWAWPPTGEAFNAGYNQYYWVVPAVGTTDSYAWGSAVECNVLNGGMIYSYAFYTAFGWDSNYVSQPN